MAVLRKERKSIFSLGWIAILSLTCAAGAVEQAEEYQVKAAFLYNFAKFVEWPDKSFPKPSDPIVICILGQNPFEDHLGALTRGKTWEGRAFAVNLIPDLPLKSRCQILFVNSSERQRFRSMATNLTGSGILTVGETPGFIDDGGIINFKVEDGKIRFEINLEAAEHAQLKLSSKLLSLAQIVKR